MHQGLKQWNPEIAPISILILLIFLCLPVKAKQDNLTRIAIPFILASVGICRRRREAVSGGRQATMCVLDGSQTITEIAEQLLSDPQLAGLIVDINRAHLKERVIDNKRVVDVAPCQPLFLPTRQQIMSYTSSQAVRQEIITVFSDSNVDRSELHDSYAAIFGLGVPSGTMFVGC
ncbi:MAG TPA: hypothetical protein V6D17_17515 [Candidatus Obscuribacterales bacterium]